MPDSSPSNGTDLLAGLRVVDLTLSAGRLTGRLLADLGPDVVRVDPDGPRGVPGASHMSDPERPQ